MIYEAESGDLNLVAVGDSMVTQRLSVYREPRYLELVELVRGADAAFTNLEMTFHNWDIAPGLSTSAAFSATIPAHLQEYRWMGFSLGTMAHNHHNDYGIEGLLASQRHVEEAGLVHAGAGRNLAEARAPRYLETPKGRIALLACASTFVEAGLATHQRPDHKGRAGISGLHHHPIYTVDPEAFDQLQRISRGLGLEANKDALRQFASFGDVPEDTEAEFHFIDRGRPAYRRIFRRDEQFAVSSAPDATDTADILKWVKEARRQADWVLMSIHCHEQDMDPEAPPAFLETFARACVDEGVDVFIGHGPHFARGLEIYNGKPILYGLGNFVFQNETYRWAPQDTYNAHGLGYDNTTADAWDSRTLGGTASFYSDPKYWRGLVAQPVFKGWKLQELRLHVTDLGYRQPRSRNGRPVLADVGTAASVLERVARLSKLYGTRIEVRDGVGIVRP